MADAGRWKPYEQRQGQLLPAFVDDALDRSDPVFFIDEAVEQLRLEPLEARYARMGEHAYAPRLLLKLWLYAATQGVYSGREIARRCRRDLAFRYLVGASAVPDCRTIDRFRVRQREDFAWVLRRLRAPQDAGGAAVRGAQTGDALSPRAAARAAQGARRVESRERRGESAPALRADAGDGLRAAHFSPSNARDRHPGRRRAVVHTRARLPRWLLPAAA